MGPLQWVKLRSMQVFWPACVYDDYSAAIQHAHDVKSLRDSKPVLDDEDRVLYFFGVGPRACHVVASGSAPNLQLCVAHEDDVMAATWHEADEFEVLCDAHQVPQDLIRRAQLNSCFLRACEEATAFRDTVKNDVQACELFITLLKGARKVHGTDKSVVAREVVDVASPACSPVKKGSSDVSEKIKAVANVLKGEAMTAVVAQCWQQMLKSGWETISQADGTSLYKMPGVSFFEFVPNVNIFDSMARACARYLRDWVQKVGELSSDNQELTELTDFVWPMAMESGWEAMASPTETLYKKADTPFDQWVPNVTIFRTKAQAVAKFLQECGLADTNDDEAQSTASDAVDSDVDMEESELEEASQDEPETAENPEDLCEEQSEEEDNQPIQHKTKRARSGSSRNEAMKPQKTMKKSQPSASKQDTMQPAQQEKKTTKKSKKSIPPFKLTFGKIERELKLRGWYWKNGGLNWVYYQPHCKAKAKESLKQTVDYFFGREELETYLEDQGLYNHIYEKLYEEHINEYMSESDIDEEDVHPAEILVQMGQPKPAAAVVSRRARSRSNAPEPSSSQQKAIAPPAQPSRPAARFRRERSKSVARPTKGGFASSTTLGEVKFGEIWSVLSGEGWHYRTGMFEYDYFKPHCQSAKDGKAGVDYFQSKEMLIDYLHRSGIWRKTAARVRAEAEADMSDSDSDSDDEAPTESNDASDAEVESNDSDASDVELPSPSQKRERDEEATPAQQSRNKKSKTDFQTPTANHRAVLSDDEETISPDSSKETTHGNSAGGPSRSLANSFTPSPGAMKKGKGLRDADVNMEPVTKPVEDAKKFSPHKMIMTAIQQLSSGYTPTNFRHREKEFDEICDFFRGCFGGDEDKKTSLYISGAPGCGKTALLKATESQINELYRDCCPDQTDKNPVRCHVNAMALADSKKLFCNLAQGLTKRSFSDGDEAFEAIERATTRKLKSSRTLILILDEIDVLLKNNGIENDLCRLFELAHRPSHSFILIGIANQVDFTERHLPLLQERLSNCSPRVVIFEPYKHQTIEQILIQRLGGDTLAPKMVSLHGISFLARKIASTTGDIRLAVDTCRRIMQHKLDTSSCDKENADNNAGDQDLARPLPLTDMLRIVKHALESKSAMIIRNLPRNLQLILFASTRLLIVTANRAAANGDSATPLFSVNELYSCYCEVSKEAGVFRPMAEREFRTGLETLSSEGLIAQAEFKRHLIKLLFSTSELLQSFRKDNYFSRLV